ncbi:LON peptidase substrate-binding domain-containing protein [Intrasporangium oryzae]|nr:LON peptidase substrate-binding domain-containing protein [Intrasporangium oryzae]
MATLPLFPLGTVLMPGAQLPLQIFEPRYVRLLRDLLEAQDEQLPIFGVVAIREGFEVGDAGVRALHPVGCAALLTQAAVLGGQRYLVISEGTSRFTLDGIDETAGTPYVTAQVTWLDEPDGDGSVVPELARQLRVELTAYRATLGMEPVDPPAGDHDLSYWVPEGVALDLADRQSLLASSDTESRLRLGLRIVRRERALTQSFGAVPQRPEPPLSLN